MSFRPLTPSSQPVAASLDFWTLSECFEVRQMYWVGSESQQKLKLSGNYFLTREDAEHAKHMIQHLLIGMQRGLDKIALLEGKLLQ